MTAEIRELTAHAHKMNQPKLTAMHEQPQQQGSTFSLSPVGLDTLNFARLSSLRSAE